MYQYKLGSFFMSAAGVATAPAHSAVSPPIFLKPNASPLPNGKLFNIPGSGATSDVFSVEALSVVTTVGAGSTANIITAWQGATGVMDNSTTIATTPVLSTDTTIELAALDGIQNNCYVLVISAANPNVYEWMQSASTAATGVGALKVNRAQFGTTAQAFAVGDYVYFTNMWTNIPCTIAGTAVTLTTNCTTAAVATPTTAIVSSVADGIQSIDYPVIRCVMDTSGSAPVTATTHMTMKTRSTRSAGLYGA